MAPTRRIFARNDVCRCPGGAVAQLGERLVRNEEVRGSNPLGSTIHRQKPRSALRLKRSRTSLAGGFFDRGWKRLRSVLLAVRQNLRGIPLQAVVVQNVAICRRVVISAHPISHEILA